MPCMAMQVCTLAGGAGVAGAGMRWPQSPIESQADSGGCVASDGSECADMFHVKPGSLVLLRLE
jgi:hypothetical protein